MNKKGAANELLLGTVVYSIVLIIFTVGMFLYVQQLQNRAIMWEDYYAKEIVKIVNGLRTGDEFSLDVLKATEVAKKNNQNFDKIFSFSKERNEVCVKLSAGKKSCYFYFNEVDFSFEMKYGVPGNVLVIKTKKLSEGNAGNIGVENDKK